MLKRLFLGTAISILLGVTNMDAQTMTLDPAYVQTFGWGRIVVSQRGFPVKDRYDASQFDFKDGRFFLTVTGAMTIDCRILLKDGKNYGHYIRQVEEANREKLRTRIKESYVRHYFWSSHDVDGRENGEWPSLLNQRPRWKALGFAESEIPADHAMRNWTTSGLDWKDNIPPEVKQWLARCQAGRRIRIMTVVGFVREAREDRYWEAAEQQYKNPWEYVEGDPIAIADVEITSPDGAMERETADRVNKIRVEILRGSMDGLPAPQVRLYRLKDSNEREDLISNQITLPGDFVCRLYPTGPNGRVGGNDPEYRARSHMWEDYDIEFEGFSARSVKLGNIDFNKQNLAKILEEYVNANQEKFMNGPAPAAPPAVVAIGSVVASPWQQQNDYWLAVVEAIAGSTATVRFLDDNTVMEKPIDALIPIVTRSWQVGDRVLAVRAEGSFHSGRINGLKRNDMYTVTWDDGNEASDVGAGKIVAPPSGR